MRMNDNCSNKVSKVWLEIKIVGSSHMNVFLNIYFWLYVLYAHDMVQSIGLSD